MNRRTAAGHSCQHTIVLATRVGLALMLTLATACSGGGTSPGGTGGTGSGGITVSVSASTLNVVAGQSATLTVTVSRTGGFTGAITLAAAGLPAGVSASFSPASVPANATSSTLAVTAAAGANAGTLSMTIRASAQSVTDATATVSVNVAAPPASGSFSLSVSPTTLAVAQGQSGNATIQITRSGGFAGAVTLSVSGAPAGVTAVVTPASTTGTTATLTITATSGAAVGASTLSVHGAAQGQTAQTATLTAQVTPAPSGALVWNFCASAAPIWLAYQDDAGPWTALPVSPGTSVSIPIATRGGVAFVKQLSAPTGYFNLQVYYATATELEVLGNDWCASFGGGKQVTGSVAGLGASDGSFVILGIAGTFVAPTQPPNFTLMGVPDGARDLISSRQRTTTSGTVTTSVAERFLFRRGINPPDGSILPPLDFASTEAFDPVPRTVSIGNLGSESAQITLAYVTANRTTGILFTAAALSAAGTQDYPGVPAASQAAGDLHTLIVTSSTTAITNPAEVANRAVMTFFRDATDRAVTLGPPLATPTVSTIASAPYVRLQLQQPWQAEYAAEIKLLANQQTRSTWLNATAAYFGGGSATWQIAVPDLTAAGFDPNWGLRPGQPILWSVSPYGWNAGGGALLSPTDGLTVLFGTRGGVIP